MKGKGRVKLGERKRKVKGKGMEKEKGEWEEGKGMVREKWFGKVEFHHLRNRPGTIGKKQAQKLDVYAKNIQIREISKSAK